ncbi:MAG: glycosyltransferase [Chloroflexi bacterium]|nr:glycosyltransferase [Chloroflexota bacterium]
MRVAFIGPFGFHPNKTMRSRALPLARELVKLGHEVAIAMPPWQTPAEAGKKWVEEGVQLEYVSLRGGIVPTIGRLLRAAHAHQPDIIHCFKPKAYSGLSAWWVWHTRPARFPKPRRSRLFMDTDDWEGWGGWNDIAPYSPLQKRFFAWQEQWGLRHHDGLTVASRALQTLAWGMGVPPATVHYLPNGMGISAEPTADRLPLRAELGLGTRPTLLLYSRLFEFDTARLAAVLGAVRRQLPTLAILSVGTGLFKQDAAVLQAQLAAENVLEAVVDVGWVDETRLPALLGAADVALYLMDDTLLNRTKCPVKLADMAGMGLPVVAEAVGQVPEYVIHGRTGLLRPTGDVAGIAADVVTLLQNEPLRQELGTAAQQHITHHFGWATAAAQLVEWYKAA